MDKHQLPLLRSLSPWTPEEDDRLLAEIARVRACGLTGQSMMRALVVTFGRSSTSIATRRAYLERVRRNAGTTAAGGAPATCRTCGEELYCVDRDSGDCTGCRSDAERAIADPMPRALLTVTSALAKTLGLRAGGDPVHVVVRGVTVNALVNVFGVYDEE